MPAVPGDSGCGGPEGVVSCEARGMTGTPLVTPDDDGTSISVM